jgi:hypothetical protein
VCCANVIECGLGVCCANVIECGPAFAHYDQSARRSVCTCQAAYCVPSRCL